MKYTIDEINIGDEVIFYSTKLQSNRDEYWTVKGKSGNKVMIELKKYGMEEYWTIDIGEVVGKLPTSKK